MLFDIHRKNINRYPVVSAFRYDKIGVSLAGFYKLQMHGFQNTGVTFHHSHGRTSALDDVALNDTDEAFVRICVYKNLEVHHAAQLFVA